MSTPAPTPHLERHFGLTHSVALNVAQIVGAGVFVTIPMMIKELPGQSCFCFGRREPSRGRLDHRSAAVESRTPISIID